MKETELDEIGEGLETDPEYARFYLTVVEFERIANLHVSIDSLTDAQVTRLATQLWDVLRAQGLKNEGGLH